MGEANVFSKSLQSSLRLIEHAGPCLGDALHVPPVVHTINLGGREINVGVLIRGGSLKEVSCS